MKWEKLNINLISDEEYLKYYSVMDGEKKARVDKLWAEYDKKRVILADYLARRMISRHISVSPKCICFKTDRLGKPFVLNGDIHFNISHSGEYVVCAVSNYPVGIDIQKIHKFYDGVARRICNEDELKQINGNIDRPSEFTKLWTQKESVLKMLGTGIAKGNIKDCLAGNNIQSHKIEDYWVSICHNE